MKYYFLISFLPDIQRDDRKIKIRLSELLDEKYLFTDRDWAEIELILLARDLLQIERLWSDKVVEVEYSLYGRDFWKEQIRSPRDIPEFLEEAFDVYMAEGPSPGLVNRMYNAYYDYALEHSKSPFLRAFLRFERDMRNIIAALRARRKGLLPSDHLIGEEELVDLLGRSTSEDFGLASEYPWIEELIRAGKPLEIEEVAQEIIWNTIDGMTGHMDFQFDAVLAYLLKLHILERNLALKEGGGMEIIRQLEE
jgi:hypothetical protein